MATFYLNTPEAQATRQAFKVAASTKRANAKQAARAARFAPPTTKPSESTSVTTRKLFTGAGK